METHKTAIRPFHVNVPEEELTELRRRINATKWPDRETVTAVSKGLPSVIKGARLARALVPALYELMATHGHGVKWDPIPYPRVGFEDPLEKLDAE